MDPDETWKDMCALSEDIQRNRADDSCRETLAELTLALRDWLRRGGYPPRAFLTKST